MYIRQKGGVNTPSILVCYQVLAEVEGTEATAGVKEAKQGAGVGEVTKPIEL